MAAGRRSASLDLAECRLSLPRALSTGRDLGVEPVVPDDDAHVDGELRDLPRERVVPDREDQRSEVAPRRRGAVASPAVTLAPSDLDRSRPISPDLARIRPHTALFERAHTHMSGSGGLLTRPRRPSCSPRRRSRSAASPRAPHPSSAPPRRACQEGREGRRGGGLGWGRKQQQGGRRGAWSSPLRHVAVVQRRLCRRRAPCEGRGASSHTSPHTSPHTRPHTTAGGGGREAEGRV